MENPHLGASRGTSLAWTPACIQNLDNIFVFHLLKASPQQSEKILARAPQHPLDDRNAIAYLRKTFYQAQRLHPTG
ncbi:MAG: hypothetical protein LBB76_10330 [Azoarcus sp.]|jgi:hypothetical protein|nr:hypothetical protein [Azoarcus sp.]